jgi:hypothetical protein
VKRRNYDDPLYNISSCSVSSFSIDYKIVHNIVPQMGDHISHPERKQNVNILISKHIYSYCTNRRLHRTVTHSVDGFLETVSRASIHLHKSKSVVVPRIYNRWQHALRHTIWSSHLKHKITQTKNLMTCKFPSWSAYRN